MLKGQNEYSFQHLSTSDGLSSDEVYSIIKDKFGYIWIGTSKGLNCFNGYEIKHVNGIFLSSEDPVFAGFKDAEGDLWFGSENKILKYDYSSGNLICQKLPPIFPHINVSTFHETKYFLWIGSNKGLFKFDKQHKKVQYIRNPEYMDYNVNKKIVEDSEHNLWFSSAYGLIRYDPLKNNFHTFLENIANAPYGVKDESTSLCFASDSLFWIGFHNCGTGNFDCKGCKLIKNKVYGKFSDDMRKNETRTICEDKQKRIWIGKTTGIEVFDLSTNHYSKIISNSNDPDGLSCTLINTIFTDDDGIVWIGTASGGVNYYNPNKKKLFRTIRFINNSFIEQNKFTKSFCSDSEGNLWIGTDYGLNKFNSKRELVKIYIHDKKNINSISEGGVSAIYEDSKKRLLVGTWGGGLNILNKRTNTFSHIVYQNQRKNPQFIGDDNILEIKEDTCGRLWMGMVSFTIDVANAEQNKFVHFEIGSFARKIVFDKREKFAWCISDSGIYKINMQSLKCIHFTHNQHNVNSISSNSVNGICIDANGILWLATNNGLDKFDPSNETVKHFGIKNGLPSSYILCIQIDPKGNLWISHDRGITKFDPQKEMFWNFDENDGANRNAGYCYQKNDGEMFFGGPNGMISFYPDEIKLNKTAEKVVITGVKIFNEPHNFHKNRQGNEGSNAPPEIVLHYDQSVITIEYASINYESPGKIHYCYKLNGFSNDWNYVGTTRSVTYINIPEGTYSFNVKASNSNGVWNDNATSINLIILPPFWKTLWFKILIIISICIVFLVYIRFKTYNLQRQKLKLQELVSKRTQELLLSNEQLKEQTSEVVKKNEELQHMSQQLHVSDQNLIHLLINISHEIRTPLSLIIGPVASLLNDVSFSESTKEKLNVVYKNALRMARLMNQTKDISKIESNSIWLQVKETKMVEFIESICKLYEYISGKQHIKFNFLARQKKLRCWVDQEKLEHIIFNLLSNAFKFTQKGEITLNISGIKNRDDYSNQPQLLDMLQKNGFLGDYLYEISITDSGIGIAPDKIDLIFDRFYQIRSHENKTAGGTGIGLNIVRDLVKLHHGTIVVKSEPGIGSSFTIYLPAKKNQFIPTEILMENQITDNVISLMQNEHLVFDDNEVSAKFDSKNEDELILLIVEDNYDLRKYLKDNFENDFKIILADNGKIAVGKAIKYAPDLILSDIMMPEMDGFELCQKIKSNLITSHIPVILLTAKVGQESQIKGFEFGADDYISKPFDVEILKARVKNLIDSRCQLRSLFSKQMNSDQLNLSGNSIDERFLKQAFIVVDKYISENSFDPALFAKELNMSRANLYAKIKALTGQTVTDFVQIVRIKRAASLISEGKLNISEVAYAVGFSTPSHFSRCFKNHFGYAPSEYSDNNNSSN